MGSVLDLKHKKGVGKLVLEIGPFPVGATSCHFFTTVDHGISIAPLVGSRKGRYTDVGSRNWTLELRRGLSKLLAISMKCNIAVSLCSKK